MKKTIFKLLIILAITSSCTSENDFKKGKAQLEQQGYTNIRNTGFSMFCCGEEDCFSTGFKCNDKNGNLVKGCFCSDITKGITIRFE